MNKTIEEPPDEVHSISDSNGWSSNNDISNNTNSTLLYIAVEYVKNEFKSEFGRAHNLESHESFSADFQQHVSSLDPNMSTAACYSPAYAETSNGFNPIVIQQLVTNEVNEQVVGNLKLSSNLENTSTVLCDEGVSIGENDFLQLVTDQSEGTEVSSELDNSARINGELQIVPKNEREVEILITDQSTGISYSISGSQEFLVESGLDDEQLLDVLSPDLDTDFLTIDESTLKEHFPEDLINVSVASDSNYVGTFEEEETVLEEIEGNQSTAVFVEKNADSHARTSIPEAYLSIHRINEKESGVFAKKLIPRRTQFGPVIGVLKEKESVRVPHDKLELFIVYEGNKVFALDVSDEYTSNWLSFVRKAETVHEQNLVVVQYGKALYFTVIKNILAHQELKVSYSSSYAKQYNLPMLTEVEEPSWFCFECSDKFGTSGELQDHLNIHDTKEGIVKIKKKLVRHRGFLSRKWRTEALQCNICNQMFMPNKYNTLKNHLSVKHDLPNEYANNYFSLVRNFKCDKCPLVFNREDILHIHLLHHSFSEDNCNNTSQEYKCPSCDKKLPSQKHLISHISSHSVPKIKIIPESFQCPVCFHHFPTRERLQAHTLVHGPEDSKPFQCKVCKKRFMNSSALTCHTKTHFTGKDLFECPICNKTFDHVLKLKLHVPEHCENNKYTCPYCKKVFKMYSVIRKHIRAFHSGRKYLCQHCTKFFPTIDKLKMHSLKHSDHREFLCADCGKQFKRKDKLNEHCRRLHNEERENASPDKSKTGNSKNCSLRSKKFMTKAEPMDFHRFIYKCHACLVGFKRRGMLVNHLAKRHPDVSPETVPELNLPILRTTRDYYCQYCEKVYKSNSKRKAHILKIHPGFALPSSNRKQGGSFSDETGLPNPTFSQTVGSITTRPQNCSWCHKQYASKAKLMQHQRKKHPDRVDSSVGERRKKNGNGLFKDQDSKNDKLVFDETEQILASNLEEFVDDPGSPTTYCHLVTINDDDFQQSIEPQTNSHLYRLLTTSNSMVPPR